MYQINKKNSVMISSTSKTATALSKKYPILKNFPFGEFEIEAAEPPVDGLFIEEDDAGYSRVIEPNLIRFVHKSQVKARRNRSAEMAVVIFEKELDWLCRVSDKITDLDKIAKTIDKALKSDNLILKRDAVDAALHWCSQIDDGRTRLSYSTVSDILSSIVESELEFVSVVNKIGALSLKRGLVSLTKHEYEIIMTHYQFQLIYTKLILGIVIAAKISI